ncbi:MAG: bifunctional demethylmenaquinone methyltransferase/2-methoxy-6-polyprenyl-1,4-benzoquinol methylase UbiE [Bernardetiaceae bacterium]|jgi:demethylmenaquinone methyltransferase/2-methoxy-6-polyprenyl-1,4-benzoquinol methylase|nr:bifunctional demethylmenaquinone methyltransferase/2-methoxy-6-polyprenyl-1,4-benzoquinol methylase UbiE [Bernardetiaceae bacterium]
MTVVPYKDKAEGKKAQVAEMFDNISPKYDLLNRVLSAGIDITWRKKAVKMLKPARPQLVLDIATGTADFALETLAINPQKIIGVDISAGMLEYGRQKIAKLGLQDKIELRQADSEELPFADSTFDAVTVSFGVRNFEHLEQGLSDMLRVLKPGGTVLILEFSQPQLFPFKQLYNFYSRQVLPRVGRLVSHDPAAYTYLPESVKAFPFGKSFVDILTRVGYEQVICRPLTLGISSIYLGKKPV